MNHLYDLASMVGKAVRVNRGGPDAVKGKLLAAKSDHLVIHSEENGVIYLKTEHIKSITVDAKDYSDLKPLPYDYVQPQFLDMEDFTTVMGNMQQRWVQVNRGGPEKIEGIMAYCNKDMATLVVGNELVHVINEHIRCVGYAVQQNNDKEKEEKGREAEKDGKH
jgi:spore coat protein B